MRVLPRSFYVRPVVQVARDLLGKILTNGPVSGRIVEVEAYLGEIDRAAHAWRGLTPRTKVLFGPPGHAYVYLIYGRHECLNLVAEPEGSPGCVLIRALEPLAGIELMKTRRPASRRVEDLARGPANLTRAMAITRAHYGADVTRGDLIVREGAANAFEIGVSPRIGIRENADWPLRFFVQGNPCVSGSPDPAQRRISVAAK